MIAIFLFFGGLGWWILLRPALEHDPASIQELPTALGGWTGVDVPLSMGVERMLKADAHVQRVYHDSTADFVWLYIGYYGTKRGGRPEHTPWVCYPSSGWKISSAGRVPLSSELDSKDGHGELNELIVEQPGHRRLVHFWYSTHRRTALAREVDVTIHHALGRIIYDGRADGALVRISTPIDGAGVEPARERLRHFTRALVPELRQVWPRTRPSTG